MKKVMLSLFAATVVATIFAFTVDSKTSTARFDDVLPHTYASDYIRTFDNDALLKDVAEAVNKEFATVERIDLHYSEGLQSHYYTVYGTFGGTDAVAMYKVSDEEVQTQTFSFASCPCGYCLQDRQGNCNPNVVFGIQCGCIDCSLGNCNIF